VRSLAVAGDVVALQVGNVGRERRGTKGTVSVPGHASLQDDAPMTGKEPAAAECGAAAAERRVAKPRRPPSGRIRTFMTGFPCGAQHLVDKLSLRPRLPMRPSRTLNSSSSLFIRALRAALNGQCRKEV
jgi:hypothetical protein